MVLYSNAVCLVLYSNAICFVLYSNEEIAACFDRLDKDGNGVLSPEEVISVIQEKMGFDENMARYLVQMFDQNQDGSLDKTEFIQLWENMFGQ